jgi:hypothetical protein
MPIFGQCDWDSAQDPISGQFRNELTSVVLSPLTWQDGCAPALSREMQDAEWTILLLIRCCADLRSEQPYRKQKAWIWSSSRQDAHYRDQSHTNGITRELEPSVNFIQTETVTMATEFDLAIYGKASERREVPSSNIFRMNHQWQSRKWQKQNFRIRKIHKLLKENRIDRQQSAMSELNILGV